MKALILPPGPGDALWPLPPNGASLLGEPPSAWTARALKQAGVDGLVAAVAQGEAPPVQDALPMAVCPVPPGASPALVLQLCAPQLGEEDFLAVDGGVLWSLELAPALSARTQRGLPVTRLCLLPAAPVPGRVLPFPQPEGDAPALAVFSPRVLPLLDSGQPLLPQLRRRGWLHTVEVRGRLRPLAGTQDLLAAGVDMLSALRRLAPAGEQPRPGVWSRSPIPEEVELVPPCFIGSGVRLGRGSLIGPHACLEDGVQVGPRSLIQRSILQAGAQVGEQSTIYGAVVGRESVLGRCAVLNEGSALGPGAVLGEDVTLLEGVGVGPGLTVPASLRLTGPLTSPLPPPADPPQLELTVEQLLRLGRRLGRCGGVGVGGAGFRGLLLARAFACGAAAQGADVVFHDGTLPCHAAWLAANYRWPASLFADEEGEVYLYDSRGLSLSAPPPDAQTGPEAGSWDLLAGTAAAYAAAMARRGEAQSAQEEPSARPALRPVWPSFL